MNIIAYGSLMSQDSLNTTMDRLTPLKKTTVMGYKRIFDAPFTGYAYLNLKEEPRTHLDVAYFSLSKNELIKFAERESGSELIEVKKDYFAFIWPEKACENLPVLKSYIDICDIGAQQLGIDWFTGTQWPTTIVDDRQSPLYP